MSTPQACCEPPAPRPPAPQESRGAQTEGEAWPHLAPQPSYPHLAPQALSRSVESYLSDLQPTHTLT